MGLWTDCWPMELLGLQAEHEDLQVTDCAAPHELHVLVQPAELLLRKPNDSSLQRRDNVVGSAPCSDRPDVKIWFANLKTMAPKCEQCNNVHFNDLHLPSLAFGGLSTSTDRRRTSRNASTMRPSTLTHGD